MGVLRLVTLVGDNVAENRDERFLTVWPRLGLSRLLSQNISGIRTNVEYLLAVLVDHATEPGSNDRLQQWYEALCRDIRADQPEATAQTAWREVEKSLVCALANGHLHGNWPWTEPAAEPDVEAQSEAARHQLGCISEDFQG